MIQTRPRREGRGLAAVVMALLALVATFGMSVGAVTAAPAATMKVTPSASSVAGGTTFTVDIVQSASVGTLGSQGTLTFDPTLVQVKDLKSGLSFVKGFNVFGASFDGTADRVKVAADKANQTGTVVFVASASNPAGDATVMTVTMEGVKGPGGKASFALRATSIFDQDGNTLSPAITAGAVTVAETPGVTAPPKPSGFVIQSAAPEPAVLSVVPEATEVAVGGTVKVDIKITTTSLQVGLVKATLTFDRSLLQVQAVDPGPLAPGAPLKSGLTTIEAGISQANASGTLTEVTVALPTASDTSQGLDGIVIVVTMKGIANGTSTIDLGAKLETPDGGDVPRVSQGSQLVVGSGGPKPGDSPAPGANSTDPGGASGGLSFDPLFATLAVILVLLALGDLMIFVMPRRARKQRLWFRRWPLAVSLCLGLVPVAMFVLLVAVVVVNALPALGDPGLGALLGNKFVYILSGQGNVNDPTSFAWGLLPALWGTIEITAVAVLVALPVSLAMAVVSTEFPMGVVGRVVRPLVSMLSGIPPIVYAVSLLIFVHTFMIPKFAADSSFSLLQVASTLPGSPQVPPAPDTYNSGTFPWGTTMVGGNSVLLGGVLVALLLIPFMTPMIADAIRNVPTSAREASLALGANRTYTLRRAILPVAVPGMLTAVALGTLKAAGDIVIVSLAVGWEANAMPSPILDIFEKTPSLASEGANMITAFNGGGVSLQPAVSIGFLTALFFLFAAGVMVLSMNGLKARWRRRLGA